MLKHFQEVLYIQLSPERISIRNPKTGNSLVDVPEFALRRLPTETIVAVGRQARLVSQNDAALILCKPFAHPRSLISDFTGAAQVLKALLSRMPAKPFWMATPLIVLHPTEEQEGGLTQIEIRALHELMFSAGAAKALLWQGPDLSDAELLARQFPGEGQVLS